jgi:chaperonin GroES
MKLVPRRLKDNILDRAVAGRRRVARWSEPDRRSPSYSGRAVPPPPKAEEATLRQVRVVVGQAVSLREPIKPVHKELRRMTTNLKPLADRVIIKPKPKQEQTPSGIVLPDTVSERPQEGTVIAVGPGRLLDSGIRVELEVKSGDAVLFAKYAGIVVKLEDEEYLVIRENELLAVVANGSARSWQL